MIFDKNEKMYNIGCKYVYQSFIKENLLKKAKLMMVFLVNGPENLWDASQKFH